MRKLRSDPEIGARTAALTFMSGVSNGWSYPAFEQWYRGHLLAPGRMQTSDGAMRITVHEPGVGSVELSGGLLRRPWKQRMLAMSCLHVALVTAHTRVLTALRGLVVSDSSEFVRAARRSRRLVCSEWELAWFVSLRPSDALSDCVLALFAADYAHHRTDYEELGVCRICGLVRFRRGWRLRTLCERHAAQLSLSGAYPRHPAITRQAEIGGALRAG